MKKMLFVAAILVCLTVWIHGSSAQTGAQDEYVSGEVLVRFPPGFSSAAVASFAAEYNLESLDRIATINLYRMKIPAGSDEFELSAQLSKDTRVVYAEPNFINHITGETLTPNDTLYSRQWHYRLIHMPDAWDKTTGSSSLIIAVVDTGARFDHPDVGSRFSTNGYDFVDGDHDPTDTGNGHGTHVAGTIGAITNNSLGVAGMTWAGTLLPVRVFNASGSGTDFQVCQGFLYAAGLLTAPDPVNPTPAQVINYSGGGSASQTKLQAMAAVNAAGVVMACAAGNDNGPIKYPAGYSTLYPMLICVGATDYGNGSPTRAYYSNYGAAMNVVAPGGDTRVDSDGDGYPDGVLSSTWDFTSNTPTYEYWMGTSMATPHVAGLAALMLAKGIPAGWVRAVMQNTATDLGAAGFDNYYGYGLINAAAALDAKPGLFITLNKTTYVNADTLIAQSFKLVDPLPINVPVELKVWLGAPGIGSLSVFNIGADGSFTLPAGLQAELGPLTLGTITAAWPRGSFELSSRMVNPVTGQFISEDLNPFTVQ